MDEEELHSNRKEWPLASKDKWQITALADQADRQHADQMPLANEQPHPEKKEHS